MVWQREDRGPESRLPFIMYEGNRANVMKNKRDEQKKIAILLATRDGEKYIGEMLDSLLAQTFQDFVCYIHDDGSSDGTLQVVSRYLEKYPEKFQLLEGPFQGEAKKNFLWMLGRVDASLYMFADQDDVWLPEKIEKTLGVFCSLPGKYRCVFTDMYVTDEKLRITSDSMIRLIGRDPKRTRYGQIMIDNPAAGCTMLFDRALRDKALQLKNPEHIEMHDQWVLVLGALFGTVAAVDEPLVYYRQHGDNAMGAEEEQAVQKASRNVKEISEGEIREEKAGFIQKARMLAAEILSVDGIPEEERKVLQNFVELEQHGKLYRILFYARHHFDRKGLLRTLWMWLWV